MHQLYELKETLLEELKQFSGKPMNGSSLQMVDTLAHSLKNLCKVIEYCEEDEGGSSERRGVRRYRRYSREGGSSYDEGSSYERGGSSYEGGSSYDRASERRGRYSSNNYYNAKDDMTQKLRELMDQAPDEKSRQEIQRVMQKLEQM